MQFSVVSLVVLLLVASCDSGGPRYVVKTLPSGKPVKVVSIGKVYFTNEDPALMLRYQTDLSIDDEKRLREEVEEIWPVFKIDVEKTDLKTAAISANEEPTGTFIRRSRSFNFAVRKGADGTWRFADNAK